MNSNNDTPDFPLVYKVQLPDEQLNDGSAIFMLHGVGSNEQDLFSLASRLPKSAYIFSLRGPITLGPTNYAWYHLDLSTGKPRYAYDEVEKSRELIIEFIDAAIEEHGLDPDKIVLLGFSQGTIMSYSVAIAEPELATGIAAFSGRMLIEDQEALEDISLEQMDVFMSHSPADKMLTFNYAKEAQEVLEGKIRSLEFHTHGYGHAIDPASIEKLTVWFENIID